MALAMVAVGNTKINPNLVDEKLVDEQLAKLGLGLKADVGLREKVKAFGEHLEKQIAEDSLCKCARCGAPNDMEDPRCPFCGNVDGEETAAEAKADAPSTEIVATEIPEAARSEPKVGKGKKARNGSANGHATHAAEKPAAAAELVLASEAKLDDAVKRINELKGEWHGRGWQLGKEIGDLIESGLWKARVNAGKPAYKRFDEFCQAEIGISSVQAKKFADVALHFTEEQFRKLGANKLAYLLALPEGKRGAVADEIDASATSEQVKAKRDAVVREYEEEHGEAPARAKGPRVAPERANKKPKKSPSKAEAPERSEVTVALVLGKGVKTYFFQAKGEGAKPATVGSLKRDKVAYGVYEPKNKVLVHVELREADDGQLFIVEKPKRA